MAAAANARGLMEVKEEMKPINIIRVCLLLTFLACACSIFGVKAIVHAQEETSTLSPAGRFIAENFDRLMSVVLPAAVIAAFTSYLGYKKSHTDKDYDKTKLIYTAIIAIAASVLTTGFGLTYDNAWKYLSDGSITIYFYWFAQWISPHLGFIPATNPTATPPGTTPPKPPG
jgi:hypothetical protein